MKKIVAAFLFLALSATSAFAWKPENMNRRVEQTNFIINGGCSGTLVSLSEKIVLTNHHCIVDNIDEREREVVSPKGEVRKIKERRYTDVRAEQRRYEGFSFVGSSEYTADILVADQLHDVAVLRIRGPIPQTEAAPMIRDNGTVTRGEPVYIVGNPAGLDATIGEGVVSNVNRSFEFPWTMNEKLPMIQHSAGTFFGNSGGALYNDNGELIGIPAVVVGRAGHLGLAIPINEVVKPILRENCLARVFDPAADDAACDAKRKKADKEKGDQPPL